MSWFLIVYLHVESKWVPTFNVRVATQDECTALGRRLTEGLEDAKFSCTAARVTPPKGTP